MARLTECELKFLESQGIGIDQTFDASNMRQKEYRSVMKREGKLVAYGVEPCKVAGHKLRTRYGHCLPCNTSHVSFVGRHRASGIVYLAGSLQAKLIKVGFSGDPQSRLQHMKSELYGGASDWRLLVSSTVVSGAGRLELIVQRHLKQFQVEFDYKKGDDIQQGQELFSCSLEVAIQALKNALGSDGSFTNIVGPLEASRYSW